MNDQTEQQMTLLNKTVARLGARVVLVIDLNNVILAYRDSGTYLGKAYDKYRVAHWYYSTRRQGWQQASGSLGIAHDHKLDLLNGLANVARLETAAKPAKAAVKAKSRQRDMVERDGNSAPFAPDRFMND